MLRGGGIGDLMFVLPAVESLAAAYPGAEITLLGMPSHAALLADRPAPFSAVEVLPVHPGRARGGPPVDPAATEAFVARLRSARFDLAVQAHGGGGNSNPFLLRLGARHTVGTAAPGATAARARACPTATSSTRRSAGSRSRPWRGRPRSSSRRGSAAARTAGRGRVPPPGWWCTRARPTPGGAGRPTRFARGRGRGRPAGRRGRRGRRRQRPRRRGARSSRTRGEPARDLGGRRDRPARARRPARGHRRRARQRLRARATSPWPWGRRRSGCSGRRT